MEFLKSRSQINVGGMHSNDSGKDCGYCSDDDENTSYSWGFDSTQMKTEDYEELM